MSKAWVTLDTQATSDGPLELRRRAADDFLILVSGRVLMNSRASRSEEELGIRACADLKPGAKILVGGLGMGLTLRAVLETVPQDAEVTVAELHPVIEQWCRGPLAELTEGAVMDSRVTVQIDDVANVIRKAGESGLTYDAVVLDLFEGPHAKTDAKSDPLYGKRAIANTWRSLARGGVLGVWAEAEERQFEARLRGQGFEVASHRPGRGGLRHWIVLARRP